MTSLKMMVDSYFEGLIEGNFKTAADGRRLFYPWGEWVKDRVSPTLVPSSVLVGFESLLHGIATGEHCGGDRAPTLWPLLLRSHLDTGFYAGIQRGSPFTDEEAARHSGAVEVERKSGELWEGPRSRRIMVVIHRLRSIYH